MLHDFRNSAPSQNIFIIWSKLIIDEKLSWVIILEMIREYFQTFLEEIEILKERE